MSPAATTKTMQNTTMTPASWLAQLPRFVRWETVSRMARVEIAAILTVVKLDVSFYSLPVMRIESESLCCFYIPIPQNVSCVLW